MTSRESITAWALRQASEIREGGFNMLSWKVRRSLRRLHLWEFMNGFWAVPVVLLIRALRPLMLIRMGVIRSDRIGHFVADGAEQVARLQQQPKNTIDLFWLGEICNTQWERMIRRTLPVHSWVKYVDWWNRTLPGGYSHERPSSFTQSRDMEGLYARYDVKIPFLPTETEEALSWLRSKGWTDGEPFVCLLVRDDEFLANDPLQGNGTSSTYAGWSHHDYRNSDIDTYIPAIQWLAEQGVWVIRMGKIMGKPLPTGMDHVVDFAFDPDKSDLLDIWLFANCSGCISTATGPDMIALVYDWPLLFVNAMPLGGFWSFANAIWVPKPLCWKDSGQPLSVHEHLQNSFSFSSHYDAVGIDVFDMTPAQIKLAVQEFWQRRTGTWQVELEDELRQQKLWDTCMAWPEYSAFHGWRHKEARIGAAWLRSMEAAVASSDEDIDDFGLGQTIAGP